MRRTSWIFVLFFVIGESACGSTADKKPPSPDAPTELVSCPDCGGMVRMPVIAEGLAQGVAITEIAAFQSLKVPIMKDGKPPDRARSRSGVT
jgi:hypothetical protein